MMADTLIFPEQTLQLETSEQPGIVYCVIAPSPFVLVSGETYRVVLDGVAHVSTCVDLDGVPCITNADDLDSEEMPPDGTFVIEHIPAGEISSDDAAVVTVIDSSNSTHHTLTIYQVGAAGIVLKDRNGEPVTYDEVEIVRMTDSDGATVDFIPADTVPEPVEKSIDPDFSGGDMEVTPKAGEVFSKVTVQKPANLIPAHIAEGIDVAGIIGTMKAGGGGGNIVVAQGDFIPTNTVHTINHNLGVVPDVAAVICTDARLDTSNYYALYSVVNFSKALYAKGITGKALITMTSFNFSGDGAALDGNDPDGQGILANATDTTMSVGSAASWMRLVTGEKYYWLAIGGLT